MYFIIIYNDLCYTIWLQKYKYFFNTRKYFFIPSVNVKKILHLRTNIFSQLQHLAINI